MLERAFRRVQTSVRTPFYFVQIRFLLEKMPNKGVAPERWAARELRLKSVTFVEFFTCMGKKKKKGGPHYFREPLTLRLVNCKKIPGERARKACREWNKYVKDVKAGRIQIEEPLED